jgi:hypothetical protein
VRPGLESVFDASEVPLEDWPVGITSAPRLTVALGVFGEVESMHSMGKLVQQRIPHRVQVRVSADHDARRAGQGDEVAFGGTGRRSQEDER